MNKKIAIALDKNGDIAKTHFGDADHIYYLQITDKNELVFLEKKENILKTFEESGHGHDKKIVFAKEVLKDVQFVISGAMSPNFKRLKHKAGIYPIVTNKNLEDTINYLKNNLSKIYEFFTEDDNLVYIIEKND